MVKENTKSKRLVPAPLQPSLEIDSSGITLPREAHKLGEQLIEIARHYLVARRRRGEALLDAARWLSEARAVADEGRWYLFLDITHTSPDVAERLLNIHLATNKDRRFAEAIISGHLNQTVAGILARPSTPTRVIDEMLEIDTPPRVSDVQRAMRGLQYIDMSLEPPQDDNEQQIVDTPHYAGGMPSAALRALHDLPPWVTPACEQIARARTTMLSVHGEVEQLDEYGATLLAQEIDNLLTAVARITKALQSRKHS